MFKEEERVKSTEELGSDNLNIKLVGNFTVAIINEEYGVEVRVVRKFVAVITT